MKSEYFLVYDDPQVLRLRRCVRARGRHGREPHPGHARLDGRAGRRASRADRMSATLERLPPVRPSARRSAAGKLVLETRELVREFGTAGEDARARTASISSSTSGEFVALTGLSAARARARCSTCSARSIARRAGQVLIDGVDIGALDDDGRARAARQEARLRVPVPLPACPSSRVLENVMMPDAPARRSARADGRRSTRETCSSRSASAISRAAAPAPALGRSAAARRHRARGRQRPAHHPRRRADGQPRLEERGHRDGGLRAARARAGPHDRDGHPRAELCRAASRQISLRDGRMVDDIDQRGAA